MVPEYIMSNHIPILLTLPVKYNIFNLHYQRVQALIIDKHTRYIQKLCYPPKNLLLKHLSKDFFWLELKGKANDLEQVEVLQHLWIKLKPLAYLNSKQLIHLYQDHVCFLERSYEYLIAQFPDQTIKDQLKDNVERLAKLKILILEGLRYRAQVHQWLRSAKNVDDVLASICHKINQLKILELPLKMPGKISATLDDDRRLFIFDLLKLHNVDESALHNEILSPIPKKGSMFIRTRDEIIHDLVKFNQYRNKVIKNLDLRGVGEYIYVTKNDWNESWRYCKNFLENIKKIPFYEQWNKLRFFIYTALSWSAYQCFMPVLQPLGLLYFSTHAVNVISNTFFYTLAIAPVWWKGYHMINAGYAFAHDYLTCWKKREILDSLIILEKTEHFIAEKLSQIIIDIPHFDIKDLHKHIKNIERALHKANAGLNRYALGEQFICGNRIKKEVNDAKDKIKAIKIKMKEGLTLLAFHVALRVGEDITLLDESFDSREMLPILPEKQLANLSRFVYKVGDDSSRAMFDKNANIIKKWYQKILSNQFSYPMCSYDGAYPPPWGGSSIKMDSLKGWDILLKSFAKDPVQQNAILLLNTLLQGKQILTVEQVKDALERLYNGEEKYIVLERLQDFIFKTLPARSPQYAILLGAKHNILITQWYERNKAHIDKANIQMKQLFSSGQLVVSQLNHMLSSISTQEMSQYSELLDGEDIYRYSTGKIKSLKQRNNLIRRFFEEYEGNTSYAYRLIHCIAEAEQPKFVTNFACKRLSWLLRNVKSHSSLPSPFDEHDTALFNNADLHQYGQFDFTQFVMNADAYNGPWFKEMEIFLDVCRKNGFDSGRLLAQYSKKREQNAILLKDIKNYSSFHKIHAAENEESRVSRGLHV